MDALDAPFHVDLVFWHVIRTYLGLERMPKLAFAPPELTSSELEDLKGGSSRKPPVQWMEPLAPPTTTREAMASSAQAAAETHAAALADSPNVGAPQNEAAAVTRVSQPNHQANENLTGTAYPLAALSKLAEGYSMDDLCKFLASGTAFAVAVYFCYHRCDLVTAAHHAWCTLGPAAERGSRAPMINAPSPQGCTLLINSPSPQRDSKGGGAEEEGKALAAEFEDGTSVRASSNMANADQGPSHSSVANEEDSQAE